MYLLIENYSDDKDVIDGVVFRNLTDLELDLKEAYADGQSLEAHKIVKINMDSAQTPTVTMEIFIDND